MVVHIFTTWHSCAHQCRGWAATMPWRNVSMQCMTAGVTDCRQRSGKALQEIQVMCVQWWRPVFWLTYIRCLHQLCKTGGWACNSCIVYTGISVVQANCISFTSGHRWSSMQKAVGTPRFPFLYHSVSSHWVYHVCFFNAISLWLRNYFLLAAVPKLSMWSVTQRQVPKSQLWCFLIPLRSPCTKSEATLYF